MDKKSEREAKKRLKGRIWQAKPMVPSGRRRNLAQKNAEQQEVRTGSITAPEYDRGWDRNWGAPPRSRYDPDLAWQEDDWEWSPHVSEKRRAQILGRKVQAAVQRDDRDERRRVEEALRRTLEVEHREQWEVWRTWVLQGVKLTSKQAGFLRGEVQLSPSARSQMLGRVHERVRRSLTKV